MFVQADYETMAVDEIVAEMTALGGGRPELSSQEVIRIVSDKVLNDQGSNDFTQDVLDRAVRRFLALTKTGNYASIQTLP